jgi:tetratricopeptide (TPR) repeat protein
MNNREAVGPLSLSNGFRVALFHRLRGFKILLVLALSSTALLFNVSVALSDQKDKRLPDLFNDLKQSASHDTAQVVEKKIWEIWTSHEVPQIDLLMERGIKLLNSNNLDEAMLVFNSLLDQAPDFSEAWNKRATIYFLMGDFEKSMQDIQSTLALEPRHFGAISGLGLIFNALERPENALKAFRRVQEIYPLSRSAKSFILKLNKTIPGLRL